MEDKERIITSASITVPGDPSVGIQDCAMALNYVWLDLS